MKSCEEKWDNSVNWTVKRQNDFCLNFQFQIFAEPSKFIFQLHVHVLGKENYFSKGIKRVFCLSRHHPNKCILTDKKREILVITFDQRKKTESVKMWKIAKKERREIVIHYKITFEDWECSEENLLFIVISDGDNRKMLDSRYFLSTQKSCPTKEISFFPSLETWRRENFFMRL